MSTIAEEIQRLKQAKSSIKASIEKKGVTVSDTATLDSYSVLIDSIDQTGGGSTQEKIKVGESGLKFSNTTFTKIPEVFDFSDLTDCYQMFYSCTTLTTIPQLDTSQVTNMGSMFGYCGNLQTIPQLDTSQVTNMSFTFTYCTNLQTIPQLDTSRVTRMKSMFNYCSSLQSVPEMDTSKVTDMSSIFRGCSKLTDLGGFVGLKVALDLSPCTGLTSESIMNVINKAADVIASPVTLTLGSDNLAKLTDEQKAIATGKGWTLA